MKPKMIKVLWKARVAPLDLPAFWKHCPDQIWWVLRALRQVRADQAAFARAAASDRPGLGQVLRVREARRCARPLMPTDLTDFEKQIWAAVFAAKAVTCDHLRVVHYDWAQSNSRAAERANHAIAFLRGVKA